MNINNKRDIEEVNNIGERRIVKYVRQDYNNNTTEERRVVVYNKNNNRNLTPEYFIPSRERLKEVKSVLTDKYKLNLPFSHWITIVKLLGSYIQPRKPTEIEATQDKPLFLTDKFFEYRETFDKFIKQSNRTKERLESAYWEVEWGYFSDHKSNKIDEQLRIRGFDELVELREQFKTIRDFRLFLLIQTRTFDLETEELLSGKGNWITGNWPKKLCKTLLRSTCNKLAQICKFNGIHEAKRRLIRDHILTTNRFIIELEHVVDTLNQREGFNFRYFIDRFEKDYPEPSNISESESDSD